MRRSVQTVKHIAGGLVIAVAGAFVTYAVASAIAQSVKYSGSLQTIGAAVFGAVLGSAAYWSFAGARLQREVAKEVANVGGLLARWIGQSVEAERMLQLSCAQTRVDMRNLHGETSENLANLRDLIQAMNAGEPPQPWVEANAMALESLDTVLSILGDWQERARYNEAEGMTHIITLADVSEPLGLASLARDLIAPLSELDEAGNMPAPAPDPKSQVPEGAG